MRRIRDVALSASLLLAGSANAQLNNDTSPTSVFKSRPDLHAPIIDFAILRPELVSPGYIFIAPYRNLDPGPYIYDNWGNLVWSGAGHSGPKTAHTPRVCKYKGEDHLCYFEGQQHQGFARGHGVIMNKHYQIVQTVEAAGAGASSDMHEFKMTPFTDGKTALMTVYQPRQYDLSTNPRFNVHNGMGWIVEGVFQEVEIGTGKVIFEWRSLDHIDPGQSWTMPGTTDTSGTGLHEQQPWDYFHLNSIDKNAEGDYLLSARHTSAIYKVSGVDGHIIWQLGGNSPTYKQENFKFSYQHHARWISENATHTLFSFLDNASNTYNSTGERTHGWVIAIDHVAERARMITEWGAPEPEGGMLSGSQGNLQILPNGGAHIGWGEHAYFSEHTADGTPVQYGKLAKRASNVMIYRSNKYNWTGEPLTKPALWTYSRLGKDRMAFFVSWNGATEVKSWNFFTADNSSGPFELLTKNQPIKKNGFETVFHARGNFSRWAYAQALCAEGNVLASSVVSRTFVPSEKMRPFCGDDGCDGSVRVEGDARTAYDKKVDVKAEFLSTNRGFHTENYYFADGEDDGDGDAGGSSWLNWGSSDSSSSSPPSSSSDTGSPAWDGDKSSSSSGSGSGSGSVSTLKDKAAKAAQALHRTATTSTGSSIFILVLGGTLGFLSSYFFAFLRRNGALAAIRRSRSRARRSGSGNGSIGGGSISGGRGRGPWSLERLVSVGSFRSFSGVGGGKYSRVGHREKLDEGDEEERERFTLHLDEDEEGSDRGRRD